MINTKPIMKLKYGLLMVVCILFFQTNAQFIARVESVKIQSQALNQEREILIYTPVDYDGRKNEYFNVIYVFDSQNREFFDYASAMISFLSDSNRSYILVGITSPYNEKLDYSRNNDMLPVLETEESQIQYGKYAGNADHFLNYVSDEVMPYINSNYRTLHQNIAVGHSLSASFILYSLVKKPNLFRNYIAISPNLAYDNEKLAKQLIEFDYSKIQNLTYLFLSNANEGFIYWQEWKPAREKVYSFYNKKFKNQNVSVHIASDHTLNHWKTFPPSFNNALEYYFENVAAKQESQLSSEGYEVTIRLKVPNENDTIYITGNQTNLGDWNPSLIKMNKISAGEREISLKLKSPAQFKFTKGSWDSELQIIGTYNNVIIKPEANKEFEFEVVPSSSE
jgi:predicted alpha/beta superfamily hydrolase